MGVPRHDICGHASGGPSEGRQPQSQGHLIGGRWLHATCAAPWRQAGLATSASLRSNPPRPVWSGAFHCSKTGSEVILGISPVHTRPVLRLYVPQSNESTVDYALREQTTMAPIL